MRRVAGLSAALLGAIALVLAPTAASATTTGPGVTPVAAAHRPQAALGLKFTPTPTLEGHPQWKADTRVGYSLKNFTTDQAKIVRSALKENGKAIDVTFYPVTKGARFTVVKHKLFSTNPAGQKVALPNSVVGVGGPSWNQSGQILAGSVQISPRAGTLSASQFRSVVLHEIGHASGLDHSDHATSVMYPSLQPDSPSHYSAEDLAALKPRS